MAFRRKFQHIGTAKTFVSRVNSDPDVISNQLLSQTRRTKSAVMPSHMENKF